MDQASYLKIGDELIANAILDLVEVTQELNEHWWCRVECRQTEDARFPFEQALGKACQIITYEDSGAEHIIFDGIVLHSALVYKIFGSYGARITAVTRSWLLDQTARHYCYTTPSITAIANQVVGRAGLDATISVDSKSSPLQYVQWGETDCAFLTRLADDHRCWIRPTATGIEIRNTFQAGSSATFRDEYQLLNFTMRGALGPASMDGAHYDARTMVSQTYTGVRGQPSFSGSSGPLVSAVERESQALLPSGYVTQRARSQTLDDYRQRLQLESERSIGSKLIGHGVSRVQQLKAGDSVNIGGTLDAKGNYGLVKVIHRWTQVGYENEFWCTPWQNYIHPQPPVMRSWTGVVPARVVEHSDPEKYGRVRIRFFWQDEGDPMLWARVVTPYAGQDRGFFFQPEVGDEVLVTFEDGDVERPVIIGSMWNGVDVAPTEEFWGGEYASNDVKRITTKSGHRIAIVDKAGKESISLATPRNLEIGLFQNADEMGRSVIQLRNSNGDIILSAPNGRIHLHSKLVSREVGDAALGTQAAPAPSLPAAAPPPAAPSQAPRVRSISTVELRPSNPCSNEKQSDAALVASVSNRTKKLIGEDMVTTGKQPGDFGPQFRPGEWSACQNWAADMGAIVRRFNRYSEALPYARAAADVSQVGDKPGFQAKGKPCLTRLPDSGASLSQALGLPPGASNDNTAIKDADLRNDSTGFRAAVYRSETDGQLILVARDTEPNSLVDWKTNIDNGNGQDTDQYSAMRKLAGKLSTQGVPFNLAGYSKGGGLAQEAGLVNPQSKVFVFNSAGLSDASLGRTGNSSFASLAQRTQSFSADGDFLTYMNNTTDPAQQIANAQYLRNQLEGSSLPPNPISIDYRNPDTLDAANKQKAAMQSVNQISAAGGVPPDDLLAKATTNPDPTFAADKQSFLKQLDNMIASAKQQVAEGKPLRLFPPVRTDNQETIPDSTTWMGRRLSANDPGPNLGKLYQHKMDNVLSAMEDLVKKDREAMKDFLKKCG